MLREIKTRKGRTDSRKKRNPVPPKKKKARRTKRAKKKGRIGEGARIRTLEMPLVRA